VAFAASKPDILLLDGPPIIWMPNPSPGWKNI
jgi:hypothetical protein